jgi:hypothetical protein
MQTTTVSVSVVGVAALTLNKPTRLNRTCHTYTTAPLHVAARWGDTEIVYFLIENQSTSLEIDAKNLREKTPFQVISRITVPAVPVLHC